MFYYLDVNRQSPIANRQSPIARLAGSGWGSGRGKVVLLLLRFYTYLSISPPFPSPLPAFVQPSSLVFSTIDSTHRLSSLDPRLALTNIPPSLLLLLLLLLLIVYYLLLLADPFFPPLLPHLTDRRSLHPFFLFLSYSLADLLEDRPALARSSVRVHPEFSTQNTPPPARAPTACGRSCPLPLPLPLPSTALKLI